MNNNIKEQKLNYLKNPGQYLLDTGLLFEMNRKVLHPLGLTMQVELTPDGDVVSVEGRAMINVMKAENQNGVIYNKETFETESAKFRRFRRSMIEVLIRRKKSLGFIEQK